MKIWFRGADRSRPPKKTARMVPGGIKNISKLKN